MAPRRASAATRRCAAVAAVVLIGPPESLPLQEGAAHGRSAIDRASELQLIDRLFSESKYREVERVIARLRLEELSTGERARVLARLASTEVELGRCEEALGTADEAELLAAEAGADDERIRLEITRGSAWARRR